MENGIGWRNGEVGGDRKRGGGKKGNQLRDLVATKQKRGKRKWQWRGGEQGSDGDDEKIDSK